MAVEKKSIAKPVTTPAKSEPAKAAKPAAKPAAKKPAAKPAAAKKPAAKPAAKKAEVSTKVFLQFNDGAEYTEAALIAKAKEAWKAQGKKAADLTKIELYVKPEERKVYCVLNGENADFGI